MASFERQSSLDFSQGNSAFVTYRKQNECKETIDNWHESELEKLSKLFLLCFHRYIYSKRAYQGNLLTVIQAPEPSDIIWENLTVSLTQKFCRRVLTALITIVLILLSFFIVLGMKHYQFTKYEDYTSNGQISNSDNIKLKAISLSFSFTIQFINMLLGISIRYFSGYEKHETWTHYNIAVFYKLVVSTTLNTVVVIILINSVDIQNSYFNPQFGDENWFRTDYGLTTDLYSLLLVDAFLTPFMLVFAPIYLLKLWNRRKIRNGKKIVTQQEANDY